MDRYNMTVNILKNISEKSQASKSNIKKCSDRKILILLCESKKNLRNVCSLKRYGYSLHVVMPDASKLQCQTLMNEVKADCIVTEDCLGCMDSYEYVFVPNISQSMIAKLALGLQDNTVSRILWQLLWSGEKVYADFEDLYLINGIRTEKRIMTDILDKYMETVKAMGIEELKVKDYIQFVLKGNIPSSYDITDEKKVNETDTRGIALEQNLITEKDINKIKGKAREITLSPKAIITPLALDEIKKSKIIVIRREQ